MDCLKNTLDTYDNNDNLDKIQLALPTQSHLYTSTYRQLVMQTLIAQLHEYEKKVLPVLRTSTTQQELEQLTKLAPVQIMRALQWLSQKNLITLSYKKVEYIDIDYNGLTYKKTGFPEKTFLKTIADQKTYSLKDVSLASNLSSQEVGVCLGLLKQDNLIVTQTTSAGLTVQITQKGIEQIQAKTKNELFLEQTFPQDLSTLTAEQRQVVDLLLKRKNILKKELKQYPLIHLTELGQQLAQQDLSQKTINALTSALIQSKDWENASFRPYDVNAKLPQIRVSRHHPLSQVIRKIRRIYLDMGFTEMTSPYVESAFWCMDSMWIPQNHPARDVQDTFFLSQSGKIPEQLAKKIANVHTNGSKTSFKGYGYEWDESVAKQLLLRTHTTASTFRLLSQGITPPAKYFCIDRVFRNESIDATHLPEFGQVEGFVMAPDLTLAHMLAFIKEFYAKLGFTQIKFKPTYNPYTESSIEAFFYDPTRKKWIELINSGMFRPESLEPYGVTVPVIAWGMGLERLAMLMHNASRLKDLVGTQTSLDWLSTYKSTYKKTDIHK
jgi:phenylalanyl-tRNA synthetase alpha chain